MAKLFVPVVLNVVFCATLWPATAPVTTRVEVLPTGANADLITFFRNDIPVVSVVRDTLGDPKLGAHRFRMVWALSYVRPNPKQRILASLPFFYHRAGKNMGASQGAPDLLFDDSEPAKGTVSRVGQMIVQSDLIDGLGFAWRGPTRAYRRNSLEYRDMYLARALEVIEESAIPENLPADVAGENWNELRGRLALAQHLLGGYVSDERVSRIATRERTESVEDRAANYDLLRQAAEKNGLYLESLPGSPGLPREAILWFSQDSAPNPGQAPFSAGLLGIADPWNDAHLNAWNGFTETWFLDHDGTVVDSGNPDARTARMIPLAVYALDYPRVPLLLIDFRDERARRRELIRRVADDVATSVFDLTPYSSFSWFAARTTFLWVQDHRGGALNRTLREAAYGRLREALLEGLANDETGLSPLIEKKLDSIALNPFEQSSTDEIELARRQYAALAEWATKPDGLARQLAWSRARENFRNTHTARQRVWDRTLEIASFEQWHPYKPAHDQTEVSLEVATLDRRRLDESAARASKVAVALPSPVNSGAGQ